MRFVGRLLLGAPKLGQCFIGTLGSWHSCHFTKNFQPGLSAQFLRELASQEGRFSHGSIIWYENRKEGVGVSSQFLHWIPCFFNVFVSDLEKGMTNVMTGLAEEIGLLKFMGTSASYEHYRGPLQHRVVGR